jgi:hypothetical protein
MCKVQDELVKNRHFAFAISSQIHDVFHLNIDTIVQDGKIKLKEPDKVRWDEIKSKIRIDPKLSQEKKNNCGNYWSSSLMCLFGIKESWDLINLESMSLIGEVSSL